MTKLRIKTKDPSFLPKYATKGSAGADLFAAIEEPISLALGEYALVKTGIFVEIPEGFEIQIRPRSGLAFKHGVTVLNAPGTIDSDYRGEVGVLLINHGTEPFIIQRGMRIAQMVLAPFSTALFVDEEELVETARASGGFGHTGLE